MRGLGDFWRWWTAELGSLLPGARRGGARRWEALSLRMDADAIVLGKSTHRRPDEPEELARIPRGAATDDPLSGRDRVPGLVRKHYNPLSTRIEVWLPKESTLSRVVQLPAATEENLRAVLGFEMERLTPFKSADVYYDGHVVGRNAQAKQVDVLLRVAPCRIVDQALALLPSHVTAIDRQRVEIRESGPGVAVGFLPPERRPRVSPGFNTFLLVVNVCLLAAAVAVPLVGQHNALEELRFDMRAARNAAAQAEAVQTRIDELYSQLHSLVASKTLRPAAVEVLEEVARRLPDSTWLDRFELRGETLQVAGSSDAASSLIEALEGSAILSGARFVSPVTQDLRSGRERFHISTQVVPPRPDGGGAATTISGATRPGRARSGRPAGRAVDG